MTKPSNPKRTGGPKTAAGKVVTSTNALKTGVFSKMVVLPGEDPAEFDALQAHFFEDFKPVGVVEEAMVYELSTIVWKKLRLDKIEHNLFEDILNRAVTRDELKQVDFYLLSDLEWVLKDLKLLETLNIEMYRKSHVYLVDLNGRAPKVEDIEVLKKEYPVAYDELEDFAERHGYSDASPQILCGLQMSQNGGPKVDLVTHVIQREILYVNQLISLYERRHDLDGAVARVKTNRMLRIVQRADVGAVRSHLDARFYKLLSELRKQKDWVRKNRVIDVTQEHSSEDTAGEGGVDE